MHKILKFRATSGFGKWKKYFPEEAVAHPAKINLHLLEYLIQTYTEEGETILDPMTGTGSTVVLSVLNNRNAIGVDLEEKFTGWAIQAVNNVEREQTLTPKGKGIVICGDARKLSGVLKEREEEISSVLFSPPYASSFKSNPQKREKRIERLREVDEAGVESGAKWGLCSDEALERLADRQDLGYGDGEGNIGNLPFVDGVIFSPPYANQEVGKGVRENRWDKIKDKEGFKGRKEWREGTASHYSNNPADIGNLPFLVDCIVSSPPFAETISKNAGGATPYERIGVSSKTAREYSGDDGNIGNLPFGVATLPFIAAILFSAPYFSTKAFQDFDFMLNCAGDASNRIEDGIIKGHGFTPEARRRAFEKQKQGEIEEKENIGNIKDFGVDAVLTSPPYEESLGAKHHSPRADILAAEKSNPSTYTQIDESVSRLREHGRSDDKAGGAYGKSLGHPYSSSEGNIGNQKKESYLEAMKTVYAECHKILKPQGLMILILKNFIRDKKVVPLTDYTVKICESVGFALKERLLFKLPTQSFWRRLYSQKYPEVDTADLRYEHILIFEKHNE